MELDGARLVGTQGSASYPQHRALPHRARGRQTLVQSCCRRRAARLTRVEFSILLTTCEQAGPSAVTRTQAASSPWYLSHADHCQQRYYYSRNRYLCRRSTTSLESCRNPKPVMVLAAGAATQRPRAGRARSGRCSTDSGKWSSISTSTCTRRTTSCSRVRSSSSEPSPEIGCRHVEG